MTILKDNLKIEDEPSYRGLGSQGQHPFANANFTIHTTWFFFKSSNLVHFAGLKIYIGKSYKHRKFIPASETLNDCKCQIRQKSQNETLFHYFPFSPACLNKRKVPVFMILLTTSNGFSCWKFGKFPFYSLVMGFLLLLCWIQSLNKADTRLEVLIIYLSQWPFRWLTSRAGLK